MKYLFSIILILLLQSCSVNEIGTWEGNEIKTSLCEEIKLLDTKIFNALENNNPNSVKPLLSQLFLEKSGDELDNHFKYLSEILSTKKFSILNQFHIKNALGIKQNTVVSKTNDSYSLTFTSKNKESFISLLTVENGVDQYLITLLYSKYPTDWKLDMILYGQYKINNLTAPELHSKVKALYSEGSLLDAGNNAYLLLNTLNPAGSVWKYKNDNLMTSFCNDVIAEVNAKYSFPILIDEIDTKPQIINISPFGTEEGYFPMVEYLTEIDLYDTIRTKEENNMIHLSTCELFKGIDRNKKYIFYKAFNQIPNGITSVPTYGFVKELHD